MPCLISYGRRVSIAVITGTVITAVMRGGSMYATVSIINVYKEGSLAIQQAGKTMSTKIIILCKKCPFVRRGEFIERWWKIVWCTTSNVFRTAWYKWFLMSLLALSLPSVLWRHIQLIELLHKVRWAAELKVQTVNETSVYMEAYKHVIQTCCGDSDIRPPWMSLPFRHCIQALSVWPYQAWTTSSWARWTRTAEGKSPRNTLLWRSSQRTRKGSTRCKTSAAEQLRGISTGLRRLQLWMETITQRNDPHRNNTKHKPQKANSSLCLELPEQKHTGLLN